MRFQRWVYTVPLRLRSLLRRDRVERELDEELRYHVDRLTDEYVAKSMSQADARTAALRAMGGVEARKEECRDARRVRVVEELFRNLRIGARMLRRTPGFTAVAVVTLALGIGANTAVFSLVDGVILRPLPYREPDRLVRLWETNPARGWNQFSVSVPNFLDFRQEGRSFEQLAAWRWQSFNLTPADGDPERVGAAAVSTNLFPMLGVTPALGRDFTPEEDRPGGETRVVLLSNEFWRTRLGGDPAVVGSTLPLDGVGYTVAGILPESYRPPGDPELFVPLAPNPAEESRGNHMLAVFGRLADGVSVEQARAEMEAFAARLSDQYPVSNGGWSTRIDPLYDAIVSEDTRRPLYVLLGAVGLVLLIACINVASLMLARATARQNEMAIRTALGAGRFRLSAQLLTEGLLIAAVAGALGLVVAHWGVNLLKSLAVLDMPRLEGVSVDGRVLVFTLATTLLTSLLFGIVPALRVSRTSLNETFKGGSRSTTGGADRLRLRNTLVVAEIALSLMLLVGAGLLMRSFSTLRNVDPGFDAADVATMRINLPGARYQEREPVAGFYDGLFRDVAALPGVESVGATNIVPLGNGNTSIEVIIDGAAPADGSQSAADWRLATPDYFRAMRIPLLAGRSFVEQDYADKFTAAIVNEEMARRYWPGEGAVGKQFYWHSLEGPKLTVVGVAGDVRANGLDVKPRPMVYIPVVDNSMSVVVRTAPGATVDVASIRAIVRRLDPALPLAGVTTMGRILEDSTDGERFSMTVLGGFAAVALLLAAIGLYGVLAYSVLQRTPEIGVRMALGAETRHVLALVLRQGLALTLVGLGLGVVGALAFSRVMSSLLYETQATDPATYVGVSLVLALVALLACLLPARRAMRIDPVIALRQE